MRILITSFLFLFISISTINRVTAATLVYSDSNTVTRAHTHGVEMLRTTSTKKIQSLLGRKLSLKEKAGLFFLKHSKRAVPALDSNEVVNSKKGTWSLILGISSFLILGPLGAIPAIILGVQALKENPNDLNAKIGKVLGIVYLALLLFAVILVLAIFANGAWIR